MTHNANIPTSEVLNLAADLIEERGWVHGTNGWPGFGEGSGLCLEGGIMAALGLDFAGLTSLWNCPAYEAVERYTGEPRARGNGRLFRVNDRSTASQVIEVLRATAVIEAAREDAALLAEIGRA